MFVVCDNTLYAPSSRDAAESSLNDASLLPFLSSLSVSKATACGRGAPVCGVCSAKGSIGGIIETTSGWEPLAFALNGLAPKGIIRVLRIVKKTERQYLRTLALGFMTLRLL